MSSRVLFVPQSGSVEMFWFSAAGRGGTVCCAFESLLNREVEVTRLNEWLSLVRSLFLEGVWL